MRRRHSRSIRGPKLQISRLRLLHCNNALRKFDRRARINALQRAIGYVSEHFSLAWIAQFLGRGLSFCALFDTIRASEFRGNPCFAPERCGRRVRLDNWADWQFCRHF